MSQDKPRAPVLPPLPVALIDIFRRSGMRVGHAVYTQTQAHRGEMPFARASSVKRDLQQGDTITR